MGKSTRCFRWGIFIVLAFACALFAGACGTSSTGHDGGTDGGVCTQATECPGTDTDCATRTCLQGQCGIKYAAQGTTTHSQTIGDCKKNVCDGSGQTISVSDDTDVPDDHNLCTTDTCKNGTPTYTPVTTGTSCGNGQVCDATGHCVGCVVATSCPGQDTECQTRTCKSGACGFDFKPNGTVTTAQTTGDCKKKVCDGAGNITNVNDDTDKPVDGNDCTDDICTTGQASNPPLTKGTKCGTDLALVCDGSGVCVGCNLPGDCSGTDTDCKIRTCSSDHKCGFSNTAEGTPVTQQTAGDCQEVQCDGSGGTTSVAKNNDIPTDTNPCTDDLCLNGSPSNPPTAAHIACTTNTITGVCDGAKACVACLLATECSGTDTECKKRTCEADHTCGVYNTPIGTKLTNQTIGDCHSDECDGAGGHGIVVDDTDVYDDGKECTTDICTEGTPSNVPVNPGTKCGSGNNMVCDANGNCVGCNDPIDCGVDAECRKYTCVSNTCGTIDAPDGTVLTVQTPGDCQQLQCNGTGGIKSVTDNNDIIDDGNDCTGDICTNGQPTHPNYSIGTLCGPNLTKFCNGNGKCVDCNSPVDCGQDTECQYQTCITNLCGTMDLPYGTMVTQVQAGDCHSQVCDGGGNVITIVDDLDVPVDGNQCTDDSCINGVPGNPPLAIGTLCTQDKGVVCDGAGNCVACNYPNDCPGQDTECQARTCPSKLCGVDFTPAGTPTVAGQTSGDCQEVQCDGLGGTMSVADDTDLPVDNNPCTYDVCTTGVPTNPPVPADTPCGTSQVCDGNGHCVGCVQPSDCAGQDDECKTRTCVANVCNWSYTTAGTPVSIQIAGDCQESVCDGSGNTIIIVNDADVPVDNLQCTSDVCSSGIPSNPPLPAGTACTQNGGTVCDGGGNCVECNKPDDCPGQDTECQARTCITNICDISYTPYGTLLSAPYQTQGDCQDVVCDGHGVIISIANDTDLPVDGNQCTNDLCNNGVPSNPATPGAACNQSGGWVCNAAKQCVMSLAVVRVGTGAVGLTAAATRVFLEERFLDGTLVPKAGNPVPLPTVAAGGNAQCTLAGNGTTEGSLALSVDNQFLTMACYAANVGIFNVAGTASNATNRVAARVDSKYFIDTTTRFNAAFSAAAVCGAATTDGTAFWASGNGGGGSGGAWYIPYGVIGGIWLLANPTNTRVPAIFGGQLYVDSTVATFTNPFGVGIGLPTIPGQPAMLLPGMAYNNFSPYGFAMLDLNPNVAGLDTLYVALDAGNALGVEKWVFNGNTWLPIALFNTGLGVGIGVRGLTAIPSGNNVAIFGTTTEANGNRLVVIVDDGTANPPAALLYTAAPNTVLRGVSIMAH